MSVDRYLWQDRISKNHVPAWPCPKCANASLLMVEGSFLTVLDSKTRANYDDPRHEMNDESGRFVCLLQCGRKACGETCAVSGDYITQRIEDYDTLEYVEEGNPLSINPPLPMITVPRLCPKDIGEEVRAAFGLYWSDYAASLNRIRNAIELMLTEMGVKRYGRKKDGSRARMSLDTRIYHLKSKRPDLSDLCDRLLAVKHLGNAGSHPGDVGRDDVFDGLDILERVLRDVYSRTDTTLSKLVHQINQRKGPRKPPKRR